MTTAGNRPFSTDVTWSGVAAPSAIAEITAINVIRFISDLLFFVAKRQSRVFAKIVPTGEPRKAPKKVVGVRVLGSNMTGTALVNQFTADCLPFIGHATRGSQRSPEADVDSIKVPMLRRDNLYLGTS